MGPILLATELQQKSVDICQGETANSRDMNN